MALPALPAHRRPPSKQQQQQRSEGPADESDAAAVPPRVLCRSRTTSPKRRLRGGEAVASFSFVGLSGLRARAATPSDSYADYVVPVVPFRRNPARLSRSKVDWAGTPARFGMYRRSDGLVRATPLAAGGAFGEGHYPDVGTRCGWTCDWHFLSLGEWQPYGEEASSALSAAWRRCRSGCALEYGGNMLWVDLDTMEQRPHQPYGAECSAPGLPVRRLPVPPAVWEGALPDASGALHWVQFPPEAAAALSLGWARWAADGPAAAIPPVPLPLGAPGVHLAVAAAAQDPGAGAAVQADFARMRVGGLRIRRTSADPAGEKLLSAGGAPEAASTLSPSPRQRPITAGDAVCAASRDVLQKAAQYRDELLSLRAKDTADRLAVWSAARRERTARSSLLQAERARRRLIREEEDALHRRMHWEFAVLCEETAVLAERARRIAARRARQLRREELQQRRKQELGRRHRTERAQAMLWDLPRRHAVEMDELRQREILVRRAHDRAHASQLRQWAQQAKLNLARVRRAQLERERAEAAREREWLDMFLVERQRRTELEDEQEGERETMRLLLLQGLRELREEELRRRRMAEERLREWEEQKVQDRVDFGHSEQKHRLQQRGAEESAWSALLMKAQQSRKACDDILEERREAERERFRQLCSQERGRFCDGETEERGAVEAAEEEARRELHIFEEVCKELAMRPVDLWTAPRGTMSPPPAQWVTAQPDSQPALLCPMGIVRRKTWAPLGSAPLTKAVLHIVVDPGGSQSNCSPDDVLEVSAADCDPGRLRPSAALQCAAGVLYRAGSDPPAAMAQLGSPEDSVTEFGLPLTAGALRVDFRPVHGETSVDVADIEQVLRSVTFRTSASGGGRLCIPVTVYLYCSVHCSLTTDSPDSLGGARSNRSFGDIQETPAPPRAVAAAAAAAAAAAQARATLPCNLDLEVTVDVVPALFSLPPFRSHHEYCLTAGAEQVAQRQWMALLPNVSMPGILDSVHKARMFAGGTLCIRFAEGVTENDQIYFDDMPFQNFDRGTGAFQFEQQEGRMRTRTLRGDDIGTARSPSTEELVPTPEKGGGRGGKRPRRLSGAGGAARTGWSPQKACGAPLGPDDYGIWFEFTAGAEWPEHRVRRLLQGLRYENQAQVPARPKRVLELTLVEGTARDPSRPPVRSVLQVEIALMFNDDPTFWVIQQEQAGVIKGLNAPFSVWRGNDLVGPPPRHLEQLDPQMARLLPEAMVQNQHHLERVRGGHLSVIICGGAAPGDELCIQNTGDVLHMGDSLVVGGYAVGKVTRFTLAQLQVPQLRIEFSLQKPFMEFNKVQDVLRAISYTNTSQQGRLGERQMSIEMLIPDPAAPRAEPLRCNISCRVLPPGIEVSVSSAFCSYMESQGWKRLANFEVPSATHCAEDELCNFFDGGTVTVECIEGSEGDHSFVCQAQLGSEITIQQSVEGDSVVHALSYPNPDCDVPEVIGHYTVPDKGDPLVIHLGAKLAGKLTVRYDDDNRLGFARVTPAKGHGVTITPGRPRVLVRQLKALLNTLMFRDDNEHPKEVQKYIRIDVADGLGAVSQAVVEVNITRVNDPTEIILPYPRVQYRQGTTSVQNGLPLCPDASFMDVDTSDAIPGAFLSIELVSGEPSQDSLSLAIAPPKRRWFSSDDPAAQAEMEADEPPQPGLVLDGPALWLDGAEIANVVVREKERGRGPMIAVHFTADAVPLDTCAEVLRAVRYHNDHHPVRPGLRTYVIKFNAWDLSPSPPPDSRAKVEVDVLNPIIWSPTFACSTLYKEGTGPQPVNAKVLTALQTTSRLAGARIRADIVGGFVAGQDELGLHDPAAVEVDPKTGHIRGVLPGHKGHFLGVLSRAENRGSLEIDFPPDCQATVKVLQVLFRAVTYCNTSSSPDTSPRKVHLTIDTEASGPSVALRPEPPKPPSKGKAPARPLWPTEGLSTGLVEVTIDLLAIDDRTIVEPEHPAVAHVLGQADETYPLDNAFVDDEDTPVFQAPHSFITVRLTQIFGGDRLVPADHRVYFGESRGVAVQDGNLTVDDVKVGRIHHGTSTGIRADLDECPLELLRRVIHSIAYHFRGQPRARVSKYQLELTVRGGNRVEPTRVRVVICVVPKSFELHTGFHESGCSFMYLNAISQTPLHLCPQAVLLPHVSQAAGAVLEVRFGGARALSGEGYVPPLGPLFLSGSRRKSVSTPQPSPRARGSTAGDGSPFAPSGGDQSARRGTLRSAARAITSSLSLMRRSSAFSWTKGGAEQNAPDFPERQYDVLSVRPQAPLKLSRGGDMIFFGKDRIASVEQIDDSRGTHGIRISFVKGSKVTLAILDSVLHSLWYDHRGVVLDDDEGGRKVVVRISLGLPLHEGESKSSVPTLCETTETYCIRVGPGPRTPAPPLTGGSQPAASPGAPPTRGGTFTGPASPTGRRRSLTTGPKGAPGSGAPSSRLATLARSAGRCSTVAAEDPSNQSGELLSPQSPARHGRSGSFEPHSPSGEARARGASIKGGSPTKVRKSPSVHVLDPALA